MFTHCSLNDRACPWRFGGQNEESELAILLPLSHHTLDISIVMSLSEMPPELIIRIYDFLDPGSHLAFALTSQKLHTYSKDILQHHRECHSRYRLCTDENWRVIQDTLKTVATDHIAAWHLRYFRAMFTVEGGVETVDEETIPLGNVVRNKLCAIGLEQLLDLELETTKSLMLRRSEEATQTLIFALCSGLDTVDLEFFPLPFGRSWRNEE